MNLFLRQEFVKKIKFDSTISVFYLDVIEVENLDLGDAMYIFSSLKCSLC